MVLVCATDDFRQNREIQKLRFLKYTHKNLSYAKNQVFGVFQVS